MLAAKQFWLPLTTQRTNIYQNIFYVSQESHISLQWHEIEWIMMEFSFYFGIFCSFKGIHNDCSTLGVTWHNSSPASQTPGVKTWRPLCLELSIQIMSAWVNWVQSSKMSLYCSFMTFTLINVCLTRTAGCKLPLWNRNVKNNRNFRLYFISHVYAYSHCWCSSMRHAMLDKDI